MAKDMLCTGIRIVGEDIYEGKHIRISHYSNKPKTKVWVVLNKYDATHLGHIGWFPKFRKYSFYPCLNTVYEEECLRNIADFIEHMTKAHKAKAKLEKEEEKK